MWKTIAAGEAACPVTRMALAASRGVTDYAAFVNDAKTLARAQPAGLPGVCRFERNHPFLGTVASEIRLQGKLFAGRHSKNAFLRRKRYRRAGH